MSRNPSQEKQEVGKMDRNPSIESGEALRIPAGVDTLAGFRRWSSSDCFPERGRIDFLAGELEIDLSPENLFLHGAAKTALTAALYDQVVRTGRGGVFVDCTRVVSVDAQLSVEPDVLAVLWDSLESGRVIRVPAAGGEADSFIELEGAPDLVVEVISDSSVGKDRRRLPPLYAKAGIPELWLVDARGRRGQPDRREQPQHQQTAELGIHHLAPGGRYVLSPSDPEGWSESRFLGRRCRLCRRSVRNLGFTYELQVA